SRAQTGAPIHTLLQIAALLLGAVLLAQAAAVLEAWMAEDLAWRTTNALRSDLTSHVLALDGSFHARYSPGELTERIDGDVAAIADFFSRFVLQIFGNGVFLAGVLVLLFVTDWRVGLVMTMCAAGAAAYLVKGGSALTERARISRQAAADLSGFVEERYDGLGDIRANDAGRYTLSRLADVVERRFRTAWAASRSAAVFNGVVGAIFALGTAATLAVAVI